MPARDIPNSTTLPNAKKGLLEIAHQRLYPSVTNPNYLVLRSRRLIFSEWISRFNASDLTVLDIGGRYQPYRPLFGTSVGRYIAVDLVQTEMVNVLADGEALPFAPQTFDLVIATQVLEYLKQPTLAAKNIHAVLKPGGRFLASVPSCAPRFGEEERWRFTRSGLRFVLSPFSEIEIIPELYSVGSVFRTLNLAFDTFVRFNFARSVYRHTACPIVNLLGLGFENLKLTSNDQFASNYSVLATKAH